MLFYRTEGLLAQEAAGNEDSRRAQRETTRKILMKSEEFNRKHHKQGYCFVSGISDGLLTAGMIAHQATSAQALMEQYLDAIGCPLQEITFAETTLTLLQLMLSRADRYDFIECEADVLERYDLDRVLGRRGRSIEFGENIMELHSRKEIVDSAGKFLVQGSLLPELDRIYAGAKSVAIQGHPVHYMLCTDNLITRRETPRLLLQALYANGRISSKRYCFLDFYPGQNFSMIGYDSLYRICAGSAIIVRYSSNDDSQEDFSASSERETVAQLCKIANQYRNQVLTIFCLPRESKHTKALFRENLGGMTLVELQEDPAGFEQAQIFLKNLARENHIRTDKALFAKLDSQKTYLADELHDLFDTWYDAKLKTAVYPQYKDLQPLRQETIKAAPKGCAYDELQEMVGLTEAKAVIRKALNYYKMQKLCENKGMKPDNPAMHMVFTGNPGTAKTTVARLFAQIMKDNGLLSRGQLVEVGRGDLVGKYVGWTAQIVQAKFKAAKGGVLFIDEAYSLVDGHSGSYGDEAINTIVQEMENHREDVVVIFAGYPNEMEKFLQKNPGLRSRIAFHVPFADYDTQQLCQIARLMGKSKGVVLEPEALEKLGAAFEQARKQMDFGNGRYVRNLLEQARMNQASRLLEYDFEDITIDEIRTIKAIDITIPENKCEAKKAIGFAC